MQALVIKFKIFISIVLIFCSPKISLANQKYNWQQLQQLAINNNLELRALEHETRSKELLKYAAQGIHWPKISLFGEYSGKDQFQTNYSLDIPNSAVISTDTKNYIHTKVYGAKAQLTLFNGFNDLAEIEIATSQYKEQLIQAEIKKNEIRFIIAALYLDWIIDSKKNEILKKNTEYYKKNLNFIRAKYQKGLEAKWALETIQLQLQQIEIDSELMRLQIKNTESKINQMLQEPIQLTIDTNFLNIEIDYSQYNFDTNTSLAAHSVNEILSRSLSEKQAAWSAYYPQISAEYSSSNYAQDDAPYKNQNIFSIKLNWTIFDGLITTNRLRSANAKVASLAYKKRAIEENLKIDFSQMLKDFNLAIAQSKLKSRELQVVSARAEVVRSQYANGVRRFTDWEDSQLLLHRTEFEVLDYQKNAVLLKYQIEKLMNKRFGDTK